MTTTEEEVCRTAIMTANKHLEIRVHQSPDETGGNISSIAVMDRVVNLLQWEIYSMRFNHDIQFRKEFSTGRINFEAVRKAEYIQAVHKAIAGHGIHFEGPMMNSVCHIS